jgi:hypothetical protein
LPDSKILAIDREVQKKVHEIVQGLKASHAKFVDPDFGPSEKDPLGALSLYGTGAPAPAGTSKYPSPESMRWDRPQYADDTFDDNDDEEEEEEEEVDEFGDEFGGDIDKGDEVSC